MPGTGYAPPTPPAPPDPQSETLPDEVRTWSEEHVASWMRSIGLAKYAERFREEEVCGAHLLEMTDAEAEDVGIKTRGALFKWRSARDKLPGAMPPSAPYSAAELVASDVTADSEAGSWSERVITKANNPRGILCPIASVPGKHLSLKPTPRAGRRANAARRRPRPAELLAFIIRYSDDGRHETRGERQHQGTGGPHQKRERGTHQRSGG